MNKIFLDLFKIDFFGEFSPISLMSWSLAHFYF